MCNSHYFKIDFNCQKNILSIFFKYFLHFGKASYFPCAFPLSKSNQFLIFRQEYFLTKLKQKPKKTDDL